MIKLIYVNPNPPTPRQPDYTDMDIDDLDIEDLCEDEGSSLPPTLLPNFTTDIRYKNPNSYTMLAYDLSHFLRCRLILEVRESGDESAFGSVVCYFPAIQDECLEAFVWEDTTLMALILIQFHVKILEQLLVFCANHNALELILLADASQVAKLGAYRQFITHTEQVITPRGKKTALTIPTDRAAHDKLLDYMEKIHADFYQVLWKNQSSSPIIQQYLKINGVA